MAVAAQKIENRDVYEITYDGSTGEGAITATFTNAADGSKSSYGGTDDGAFVVTVAPGWTGTDSVSIVHDDGTELDSGEVTFG